MIKNFLITGRPGSGKTTICLKLIKKLRAIDLKVGGVLCPEIKVHGVRKGFGIVDLDSGREGTLAWVGLKGPRVSKYGVNLKDLKEIAAPAILNSIEKCDITFIDECGPMEFFSPEFINAVQKALDSDKKVVAVVHWKKKDLLSKYKKRGDTKIFYVNRKNREGIAKEIYSAIFYSYQQIF